MTTWGYHLAFESEPHTLRTMRKLAFCAAKAGGASEEISQSIGMAVGETLANMRFHGYGDGVGLVDMAVSFEDGSINFLIHNGPLAREFEIPQTRPSADAEEKLGLYVIGQLMDGVEVVPHGAGVAVRLTKRVV